MPTETTAVWRPTGQLRWREDEPYQEWQCGASTEWRPVGPIRVKLSRSRGWKMPPNTVKVDRSTKWGNPFAVGKPGGVFTAKVMTRRHAWQLYASVAKDNEILVREARAELRGKNLACWCPHPDPYEHDECHAAVLLEIANAE